MLATFPQDWHAYIMHLCVYDCLAGRVVTVAWWLATVILIATYTANLAAWLTKSRTSVSIKSIEDLGSQSKIIYGEKNYSILRG